MDPKILIPLFTWAIGLLGGGLLTMWGGGMSAGVLMATVADHNRRLEILETKLDNRNTEMTTAFSIIRTDLSAMKTGLDAIKVVVERVQNSQDRERERVNNIPLGFKK